ncbi:Protein WHAT'S THIS FACTOR 1-like protein [Bienertia sinuspersici]
MRRISQFKDMPYISPYSDFSDLKPGTPERKACLWIKGCLFGILIFYVSLKGIETRFPSTGCYLLRKDAALVSVPQFRKRGLERVRMTQKKLVNNKMMRMCLILIIASDEFDDDDDDDDDEGENDDDNEDYDDIWTDMMILPQF